MTLIIDPDEKKKDKESKVSKPVKPKVKKQVDEEDSDEIEDAPVPKDLDADAGELDIQPEVKEDNDDE